MSHYLSPMRCHGQPASVLSRPTSRWPTLLVFADNALLPHVMALLSARDFPIHATTELKTARTILRAVSIDLVLLHPSPEMEYGGWEAYASLRRITPKPVLTVANLTAAHFHTTPQPHNPQENADLANYLKLIDFLSHTFILSAD